MKYEILFLILLSYIICAYHPHSAPQKTIKIGPTKITYINDEGKYIKTTDMYPKAKPEDWKQFENLEITDEKGNLFIPFGGFLIESGNKKILMDLGLGTETVTFPGFGAVNTHTYLKNLEKTGIKPEEITDVFYTHLHMDHCGWTTIEKNGKKELTFPNANHWCSEEEWNYWLNIDFPTLQNNVIKPLKGKIKFVKEGQYIAPYLTAHKAPGHTPGLTILKLEVDGKIVWFTSDIFHSIMQIIERQWFAIFDVDSKKGEESRKKYIKEFIKKNTYSANGHFSNHVYGRIMEEKGILKWEPCLANNCELNPFNEDL